jgi:hypothetical protein
MFVAVGVAIARRGSSIETGTTRPSSLRGSSTPERWGLKDSERVKGGRDLDWLQSASARGAHATTGNLLKGG